MTDNEIVKALECFSSNEYGCKGCPFIECGCFDCGHIPIEISSSILELINRQKAEIEAWKHYYNECLIDLKNAHAEIERLKRKLVGYEPSIDSGLFSQMLLEQKEKAEAFEKKWKAEVKSEAYREFAERFKILLEKELHWCECVDEIIKPFDNLLKELVGDDDG